MEIRTDKLMLNLRYFQIFLLIVNSRKYAGFNTVLVIKMILNSPTIRKLKTTTRIIIILGEQTIPNQMYYIKGRQ